MKLLGYQPCCEAPGKRGSEAFTQLDKIEPARRQYIVRNVVASHGHLPVISLETRSQANWLRKARAAASSRQDRGRKLDVVVLDDVVDIRRR